MKFRGVGTALVTPWKDDGSLDEATFEKFDAYTAPMPAFSTFLRTSSTRSFHPVVPITRGT